MMTAFPSDSACEMRLSASEDVDNKMRKINAVFGNGSDSDPDAPPSLHELQTSLAELTRSSDTFRAEMDIQEVGRRLIRFFV